MAGLGIGVAFLGYWVTYYGVTQVQGGNWGFLDLGIPSRWKKAQDTPRDDGSSLAKTGTKTSSSKASKAPAAYNRPAKGPVAQSSAGSYRPTPGR